VETCSERVAKRFKIALAALGRKIGGRVAHRRVLTAVLAVIVGPFAAVLGGAASAAKEVPQRPPVITLLSKSPPQRAVWESFCVSVVGFGELCADTPNLEPRWLSVVRPGERVTIVFEKTMKVSGDVWVYKRGCEREPARRTFATTKARTHWVVPRSFRGRFELNLFADEFHTADGRVGDVSATLGILVSKTRPKGLVRNRGLLACGELY
jgi:hypothetical protein